MSALKRPRNQDDGVLKLTGRDVEEEKMDLTFAEESCTWHYTGTAAERQHSQSKQAILDLLEHHGEMSPKEMAEEAEMPYSTVKGTLHRMAQERVIVKSARGRYTQLSSSVRVVEQSELIAHTEDQSAD